VTTNHLRQPGSRKRPAPTAADATAVPTDVPGLSGAAVRTFFRIADAWQLSADEARTLLGDPPRSTFFGWKRDGDGNLSRDVLERVSYVLGIYKALQILLPEAEAADAWIRQPNSAPLFGGRPALDRMLSGNVADLYVVRQYLDGQRGG
jgi:hypothetical protein